MCQQIPSPYVQSLLSDWVQCCQPHPLNKAGLPHPVGEKQTWWETQINWVEEYINEDTEAKWTNLCHNVAQADLLRQRVTFQRKMDSSYTWKWFNKSIIQCSQLTWGSEIPAFRIVTLLVPNFLFQSYNNPAKDGKTRPETQIFLKKTKPLKKKKKQPRCGKTHT